MELIAAAPVIFLDEPTSGLSSYDAENVVQVLKKLALEGNTIITTIHQPSLDIFKQFDNLIMISRDTGALTRAAVSSGLVRTMLSTTSNRCPATAGRSGVAV